ncbi:MAG: undecaprenyl-diphosphate phosphatase [Gammaproteobacteria bacterium]|nr:undecaprenyl-diphosphate phosphatase [Gammaproteobacteria bacterium]
MGWIETVLLALVQGLTEFLPISSSAHLILVPQFFDWPDQGLAFDVAVHFGTLSAVLWYFRCEVVEILRAWLASLVGRAAAMDNGEANARLGWAMLIATIPVGLAGLLLHDFIGESLRSPLVIAATTAVFGVLLWVFDRKGGVGGDEYSMTWRTVVLIGLAQAVALIPGTSRSGVTITAGLALGLSRKAAARFSFLISIPVITLAAGLETVNLVEAGEAVNWPLLFLGVGVSAVSAYLCIKVFLSALDRLSMFPFMVYRLVLSGILLWVFL